MAATSAEALDDETCRGTAILCENVYTAHSG